MLIDLCSASRAWSQTRTARPPSKRYVRSVCFVPTSSHASTTGRMSRLAMDARRRRRRLPSQPRFSAEIRRTMKAGSSSTQPPSTMKPGRSRVRACKLRQFTVFAVVSARRPRWPGGKEGTRWQVGRCEVQRSVPALPVACGAPKLLEVEIRASSSISSCSSLVYCHYHEFPMTICPPTVRYVISNRSHHIQ